MNTPTYHYEQSLLTVQGLNLWYGPKQILRDINLSVKNIVRPGVVQGQVIALLAPSGMGKTQLFRCMAGLQPTTSGSVLLNDHKAPVQAGDVGVVQQSYPLMQHRTVRGNLELVSKDQKRITELLTRFNLVEHAEKYPVQLSGGQRQRIAIIQQLLCSKYFLLMDEPFSGLDILAKQAVIDVVNEVAHADDLNTIIITTHDLESAVTIADHIWVLGRETGKPGATVVKQYDLIERGLAWNPQIMHNPDFWPVVKELKELFSTL